MAFLEKLLRSKLFVWLALVLPGLWPLWQFFVAKNASVRADFLKYRMKSFDQLDVNKDGKLTV